MSIVIFTGLSISFDEARSLLDAEYHPPVKRGDIDELINKRDDINVIGIIDGVFHQSPAVAHKEILRALDKGIVVVGGASMGALRACELYPYGMIGIGSIFKDYKEGVIDSDDDVAVALDPDTYEALSEAYINIKYTLDRALDEAIINFDDYEELLRVAKNTFYPKRSFDYIIQKSDIPSENITPLINYIRNNKIDIKKEDARAVIKYIRDNYNEDN